MIEREARNHAACSGHPNIIRLHGVHLYEEAWQFAFLMDKAGGGELFDLIVASSRLFEPHARRYFAQILSAVKYCHEQDIVHRDIKPENILLSTDHQTVYLIDFGLSKSVRHDGRPTTPCGSPCYAAPELVFSKPPNGYAKEVDIWSLGIVLYVMLVGNFPFYNQDSKVMYRMILEAQPTPIPGHLGLSTQARDLIYRMLDKNPKTRITIAQIEQHPWLTENDKPPAAQ